MKENQMTVMNSIITESPFAHVFWASLHNYNCKIMQCRGILLCVYETLPYRCNSFGIWLRRSYLHLNAIWQSCVTESPKNRSHFAKVIPLQLCIAIYAYILNWSEQLGLDKRLKFLNFVQNLPGYCIKYYFHMFKASWENMSM